MQRPEPAIVGSAFHSGAHLARASKQPSIRSLPFLRFCPLCALGLIIVVSIPFVLPPRPARESIHSNHFCLSMSLVFGGRYCSCCFVALLLISLVHFVLFTSTPLCLSSLVQIRLRLPRVNPRLSSAYFCFESRRSCLIIFWTKRAIFSAVLHVLCTHKRTPTSEATPTSDNLDYIFQYIISTVGAFRSSSSEPLTCFI